MFHLNFIWNWVSEEYILVSQVILVFPFVHYFDSQNGHVLLLSSRVDISYALCFHVEQMTRFVWNNSVYLRLEDSSSLCLMDVFITFIMYVVRLFKPEEYVVTSWTIDSNGLRI